MLALTIALLLATRLAGPGPGPDRPRGKERTPMAETQPAHNTLTPAERTAGWRLLFDGRTTRGWRAYDSDSMPAGWQVVDGTLTRAGRAGDIITRETFRDFELVADWMVPPRGNSGIFYRAAPGSEAIYHSAPEYQVLDDAGHRDGVTLLTSAGSVYGLYPALPGVVRRAGEWNTARIVVNGSRVEHWLNGKKLAEYELGGEDWKAKVAASKFAAWPEYGKAAEGHIGLQDHGDRVAFRNIKIRVLP